MWGAGSGGGSFGFEYGPGIPGWVVARSGPILRGCSIAGGRSMNDGGTTIAGRGGGAGAVTDGADACCAAGSMNASRGGTGVRSARLTGVGVTTGTDLVGSTAAGDRTSRIAADFKKISFHRHDFCQCLVHRKLIAFKWVSGLPAKVLFLAPCCNT